MDKYNKAEQKRRDEAHQAAIAAREKQIAEYAKKLDEAAAAAKKQLDDYKAEQARERAIEREDNEYHRARD